MKGKLMNVEPIPGPSRQIVVAGGSGFLGRSLASALVEASYRVTILTRSPKTSSGAIRELKWDGKSLGDWANCLEGATAVVNLTGRSVNCRYTPENRGEIVESRVDSVRTLGEAIRRCKQPPKVLVQASSLAIYGDAGDRWCDEAAPAGRGFPAETCFVWEKALRDSSMPGLRKVVLRIGFVLRRDGGALKTLINLTRWGLGGRVGNGRQYISWIHHRDMNRMFLAAIEDSSMEGIYNATGPNPVTNAGFMRELRAALHRPWSPPTPAWATHIGAALMGTEACLALTGRRCLPKRFQQRGFKFEFTDLAPALRDVTTERL
jgi:uncharacterized protein (TIGR01777 family)